MHSDAIPLHCDGLNIEYVQIKQNCDPFHYLKKSTKSVPSWIQNQMNNKSSLKCEKADEMYCLTFI